MDNFVEGVLNFHFLRPWWLLSGIAALLLPLLFRLKHQGGSDWAATVSPALLRHLVKNSTQKANRKSLGLISLVFAITAFSLSGPTWEKVDKPLLKRSDNLVIVLDLSLSMYATDLPPNRITRAKQKIQDLLAHRKEGNTALIVYSAGAHVVTPLTDDRRTIESMLQALEPYIMPAAGSEPQTAITKAVHLLGQGPAGKKQILLIADDIEPRQIASVTDELDGIELSVLAVGTEAGGPIDLPRSGYLKNNNEVIIAKTHFDRLKELAEKGRGDFSRMTLDNKDLERLHVDGSSDGSLASDTANTGEMTTPDFVDWKDRGYLFALLLVPLALVAYRKELLMVPVALILLSQPQPVQADQEARETYSENCFLNKNQQAMAHFDNQQFKRAADLFENSQWAAVAHYRAGNYEQADKLLTQDTSTDNLYNLGNTLAFLHRFEEAIQAYTQALEQKPDFEQAAYNKKIIEDLLAEQQTEQDKQEDPQQDNSEGDQQDDQKNNQEGNQKGNQRDKQEGGQQQKNDQQSGQGDGQNQDGQSRNQQGQDGQNPQSSSENRSQNQNADGGQSQGQQSQGQQSQGQQSREQQAQSEQGQNADSRKAEGQNGEQSENREEKQQAQVQPGSEQGEEGAGQTGLSTADPLSDEESRAFEQWMRRVPDDPSGLLRRKFAQQFEQSNNQELQKENRPLW